MLDAYYDLRGWDKEGRPTKSTLKKLGIQDGPQGPKRKGGKKAP
jgi:hypothetical protein